MAQDRKVFVGGVPQDLNQDDLYAIFSEYAGVKKAWLQKCRATDDNGNSNPPQNHRGFGFVIFHDPNAIEELLGGNASRFIVLRNGAKLEVKRALSSSKMSGLGAQRAEAAQQELLAANASGGRSLTQQAQQTQQPHQQPPLRAASSVASSPGSASVAHSADLRPRHAPTLASAPQVRPGQAVSWTGSNGDSVLGQLSLMPNPAGYASAQRTLGMGVNGIMPAGVPDGMSQPVRPKTMVSNTRYLMPASSSTATATPSAFLQQQQQAPGFRPPGIGSDHGDSAAKQLREAVIKFYQQHRPDKLSERDFVDQICSYYLGRESQLDDDLRSKYGVGLQLSVSLTTPVIAPRVPPQAPPPPPQVAASMPAAATTSALSELGAARGQPANAGQPPMSPLSATQQRLLPQMAGTAGAAGLGTTYTVLPATLQGTSEPMQQPWLQPTMQGLQLRGSPMQQAPLAAVPTSTLGSDALSGLGATGISPATAPGTCHGSNLSLPSTSAATNGVSLPRGSSSCSSGAFVVGNDDGSLQGSERSAEPSQEAEDDGFEISVSVAEAIVGKGNSAVAQGREWLEGSSLW